MNRKLIRKTGKEIGNLCLLLLQKIAPPKLDHALYLLCMRMSSSMADQ